jgi:Tol biopolymer transport system component
MHLHDFNARRQFAREHADELANDFCRAQEASAPELPPERAGHADPASPLDPSAAASAGTCGRPATVTATDARTIAARLGTRRSSLISFAATALAVGMGMIGSDLRAQTMRPVPADQEIAFETPSGIHLVGVDGRGLRRLPGTRPGDQNPDWSPDGRRLVFWNGRGWHGRLYVSDVLGHSRRLLTRPGAAGYGPSDQYPAWSPDGRLIAFESFRAGAWHIWVMRPDGSGARRVTPAGRGGHSPQWSPDGRRLVYTASWSTTGIAVTDLAGRVRELKTLATDDWGPAWSPNGAKIAFNSTAEEVRGEIYVVGARGGTPVRLTRNTGEDLDPGWSPDSRQIVFDSGRSGLSEVYVMNADGTQQRRVTRIPKEYACCSSWRPEP